MIRLCFQTEEDRIDQRRWQQASITAPRKACLQILEERVNQTGTLEASFLSKRGSPVSSTREASACPDDDAF